MFRIARIALVGGFILLSTTSSSAQFIPAQAAPNSPFGPFAPQRFQPYFGVPTNSVYGNVVIGQPIPFNSPLNRINNVPFQSWYTRPNNQPLVPWANGGGVTSGYMSGGSVNATTMRNAQRELERAQRDATNNRGKDSKNIIDEEWNYEKFGASGLPGALKGVADQPEELIKALAVADESELVSGAALNQILRAVMAAESKGAKGTSSFLPPQVLAEVRFAGSPAAEALNLILQAGKLPFPLAFDDPRLKEVRDELEKDFAAVAAPLKENKLIEPNLLTKLTFTLQKAQELAGPVIAELPFDDATAAHRFLNRFQLALAAIKAPNANTLVNANWAFDGCSVADLVKHMTKHKLLFGMAPANGADSYIALHKGLATYLIVLTQPKK